MQQCKAFGLKTWSQLLQIMSKFVQDEKTKSRLVSNEQQSGPEEEEAEQTHDEIPHKEYDYLLSMPLWSLTKERVEDLIKQMDNKKSEHETLDKMPIFKIWEQDLAKFSDELELIEA